MGSADTLGEAGEQAALARLLPRLPAARNADVGPGDDAAVLRAPDGRFVVTTDTLVHGPDFRLAWSTFYDLGWKAAVTNLSDVAAMGATPTGLVIAIAAPRSTLLGDLEHFADGVREACEQHAPGCALVGGDLTVSDTLTVAVTAFGDLGGRAPVLRSGARPGDLLAVTGTLGFAGAGIALLFAEATEEDAGERIPSRARAADLWPAHGAVLTAQLRPHSPLGAGVDASRAEATAMLDVSDGLLLDASRLARSSGVRIDLDSRLLARDASTLAAADPWAAQHGPLAFVLGGGEDHALLATFPPDRPLPSGWRALGVVRATSGVAGEHVTIDGEPIPPRIHEGWDPYREWDGVSG